MDPLDTAEIWSEDGDVMYCSSSRFSRGQAKQCFAKEADAWFPDVRCRRVWMKQETQSDPKWTDWEGDNPWPYPSDYDDYYVECPPEEADFECWRVESK